MSINEVIFSVMMVLQYVFQVFLVVVMAVGLAVMLRLNRWLKLKIRQEKKSMDDPK